MEVTTKPKIFVHSWLSDDLLLRLEKQFDKMKNAYISVEWK